VLERVFAAIDYDVARLIRWMWRKGAAVLILYAVIALGLFSLADCALFVWRR